MGTASGEIEKPFVCARGFIGAGFIGYFIGYIHGKKRREENALMLTIDKLACSRLKGENPAEKLVFALITIIICLSSNSITVSAAVFSLCLR